MVFDAVQYLVFLGSIILRSQIHKFHSDSLVYKDDKKCNKNKISCCMISHLENSYLKFNLNVFKIVKITSFTLYPFIFIFNIIFGHIIIN